MNSSEIENLYKTILNAWNKQDARAYAALLTNEGSVIGFDGSQMNGPEAAETELSRIFANHRTATYIAKVQEVRFLRPEVALLRAIAGMVPAGQHDINPAVNAIQSLIAVQQASGWKIALFQNTPAQFHGRPELAQALTHELQKMLKN